MPIQLLQAISETEGEITKRKVQITAAGKQGEKLSKDCIKTQKEVDKGNADMEGMQQEQQVHWQTCCSGHTNMTCFCTSLPCFGGLSLPALLFEHTQRATACKRCASHRALQLVAGSEHC